MPPDFTDALKASVRAAQERYEAEAEAARQARRDAFAHAQKEGLSLSERVVRDVLHLARSDLFHPESTG